MVDKIDEGLDAISMPSALPVITRKPAPSQGGYPFTI